MQHLRGRDQMFPIFNEFLAFLEHLEDHPYYGPIFVSLMKQEFLKAWYVREHPGL